ncbi:GWxTD domain-containing protein [bacterium]|nr:GWxTD domain-containing protein [bacterium]MBU1652304.1 GWxTD domain-containing protein [bacterium]
MKKLALIFTLFAVALTAAAQSEFYSDQFLGLPEFSALPVRLPTEYPDTIEVQVHVRIVYDDLQFIKKNESFTAKYSLDVVLRDKDENLSGIQHLERKITADSYQQTNSRVKYDQTCVVFRMAPRTYELRIDLMDHESRQSRVIEKKLTFSEDGWASDYKLGEVLMLDSTGTPQLNSGILKGPPLRVAYKLYSEKQEGITLFFRIEDEMEQVVKHEEIPLSGSGPFFSDTITVATSDIQQGNYRFILGSRRADKTLLRGYTFTLLQRNLPSYIGNLDLAINQLKYIASDDEYKKLMDAPPYRREALFREFWERRDPTPDTGLNEKMEEYYLRISIANENFSGYNDGWQTDMGRVFVIFGNPNDIERHPFDTHTKPYEIWYYYDIDRQFVFQDKEGFGEYRLVGPIWSDY